jgi:hypothetical protein
MDWSTDTLDGTLAAEWGSPSDRPGESALVSWLVREADAEPTMLVASGSELGREGTFVALPLEGGLPGPYVLFAFPDGIPPHVQSALRQGLAGFPQQRPALELRPRAMAAAS